MWLQLLWYFLKEFKYVYMKERAINWWNNVSKDMKAEYYFRTYGENLILADITDEEIIFMYKKWIMIVE